MTDPIDRNTEEQRHLTWVTPSGTISFSFNREPDSTFVLTPTEDDDGIINIGGIADFVLEKASEIEEKDFDGEYDGLMEQFAQLTDDVEDLKSRMEPYIMEPKISFEDVKKALQVISDDFKRSKEEDNDLQSYELDLDPYALSILTILLASKKKAESVK